VPSRRVQLGQDGHWEWGPPPDGWPTGLADPGGKDATHTHVAPLPPANPVPNSNGTEKPKRNPRKSKEAMRGQSSKEATPEEVTHEPTTTD